MNTIEKKYADGWNKTMLEKFGDKIGLSLDELNKEYDDMITAFEMQIAELRNFREYERPSPQDRTSIELSSSPTLSDSSRSSTKKLNNNNTKRRTKIHSSFRVARHNIRRKITGRTMSPCPQVTVPTAEDTDSRSSILRNDSDGNFGFESDTFEKRPKKQ